MIKISKIDLDQLQLIGNGRFGLVYQKDENTVYKIYRSSMYDVRGIATDNPALSSISRRLKRLMQKGKDLCYTDVPIDFIKVDGNLCGLVLPFYKDGNLTFYMNRSFNEKMDIAEQLLRNSKELTDHHIYPSDYKLNNILMDGDEVRISDLDDVLTHVCHFPNPIYLTQSIFALQDTIRCLFNEFDVYPYGYPVSKKLGRDRGFTTVHYSGISKYLNQKKDKTPFLIIDSGTNIAKIQDIIHNHSFRILYLSIPAPNNERFYFNVLHDYNAKQVPIYDFLSTGCEDEYFRLNYPEVPVYRCIGKELIKRK